MNPFALMAKCVPGTRAGAFGSGAGDIGIFGTPIGALVGLGIGFEKAGIFGAVIGAFIGAAIPFTVGAAATHIFPQKCWLS